MKKNDRYTSLFWAVVGVHIAFKGYELGLGTLKIPGSGFLIFWGGSILLGLSLILLAQSFTPSSQDAKKKELWKGVQWSRGLKLIAALFVCTLVFKWLGFILSTFLLIFFLSKALKPQKWGTAFSFSAITTALCYLVFGVLLDTQFPQGILNRLLGR